MKNNLHRLLLAGVLLALASAAGGPHTSSASEDAAPAAADEGGADAAMNEANPPPPPTGDRKAVADALADDNYGEALAVAAKAVAGAPDDVELRVLHARTLIAVLDLEAARAEIDKALELVPEHPRGLAAMAELHWFENDVAKAVAVAEKAAKASPKDEHIQTLLIRCLARDRIENNKTVPFFQTSAEAEFRIIAKSLSNGHVDRVLGSWFQGVEGDRKLQGAALTRLWNKHGSGSGYEFVGFEIHRRLPKDLAKGVAVPVHFLWATTPRANWQQPMLEPPVSAVFPSHLRRVATSLEGKERDAFLERVQERPVVEMTTLGVLTAARAGHWFISGFAYDNSEWTTVEAVAMAVKAAPAEHNQKAWIIFRVGGMVAILLLAVGFLLWSVKRKK